VSCLQARATALARCPWQAADRYTQRVKEGGEPTVTPRGLLVNQQRVAVQKALSTRPPPAGEPGWARHPAPN
jgi:hypothetical protein